MWQDQSLRFLPKKFSAAIPKQNLTPHYCMRKFAVVGKFYITETDSCFMSQISYFVETLKSGLQALWISNSSAASRISRLTLRNLWALRGYNFIFWQNFKNDLQAHKINLQSRKLINLYFTATQKPRALKRSQDKHRANTQWRFGWLVRA